MSVGHYLYIPIIPNYNHKEADTRVHVHILHALEEGLKKIQVCTVDNDVMVIPVGVFFELTMTQPFAEI